MSDIHVLNTVTLKTNSWHKYRDFWRASLLNKFVKESTVAKIMPSYSLERHIYMKTCLCFDDSREIKGISFGPVSHQSVYMVLKLR